MSQENKIAPVCGNCKHWKQWSTESFVGLPDMIAKCHYLGNCAELTAEKDESSYDRCRVYDDSIPIGTDRFFGCIHFQAKEPENT